MQKIVSFLVTNVTEDIPYYMVPEVTETAKPYTYYCRDLYAIPRYVQPGKVELVEFCYQDPSPKQPSGAISIFTYDGGKLKYQGKVYWRKDKDSEGPISVFVTTLKGADVTIYTQYVEGNQHMTVYEIELTDFIF